MAAASIASAMVRSVFEGEAERHAGHRVVMPPLTPTSIDKPGTTTTATGGTAPRSWAPLILCVVLMATLCATYVAAVGSVWSGARAAPNNYYDGALGVGFGFTMLLFLITVFCFYKTATTDPGRVPREFPWDPSKPDPAPAMGASTNAPTSADAADALLTSSLDESRPLTASARGFERKLDGRTRFCKKCNLYKPCLLYTSDAADD